MRSTFVTVLLLVIALACGGLAGIRLTEGGLSRFFGAPPVQMGEALYHFDPAEAANIRLVGNGISSHCRRGKNGWEVIEPWSDRMDPRVAQAIIEFTLGTRVEAAFPADKIESNQLGFEDGRVDIRISNERGEILARYNLGRRTAWFGTDAESGDKLPTVYIYPGDRNRKNFIYACTGDIHPLFDGGFRHLRDHHPFLFHPSILETIRIKNSAGEMTLSRKDQNSPWNVVKPLELKTDPSSLTRLIQGLFDLRALSVSDREQVTLPTDDTTEIDQIAVRFFGSDKEHVLEIFPPSSPEATTVLARISTRPNAIFELPRKTTPDLVSLSDLPLTVNELRDPTLTSINVDALQGILISPARGQDILVARDDPKALWKVRLNGEMRPLNETSLYSLLTTVTQGKVAGFVSDAATDLAPHGLDQPFLSLRFLSFNNESFQLDFGQAKDGAIHAMRQGTTSVMRIEPSMLALIPSRIWEWRDQRLWRLAPPNISAITRRIEGQPPLELEYRFVTESWKARVQGEDRSEALSPERADRLLEELLALKVEAWLPPDHERATLALANPAMILTVVEKTFDDEGEFAGIVSHDLMVAPVSDSPQNRRFYGRASGEENLFMLDRDTLLRLAVDLFEFE